jgi:small-conductance mechanosensitive channel
VHVLFGVEYGTDVEKVRKLVLPILKEMKGVLKEPAPTVHFTEMGDFALKFKANFWVEKWNMAYDKKIEATEKIYNALNKAGIGIPFPTQTVYFKKK